VSSDDRLPHLYFTDLADKEMAYLKRMNWKDFDRHISGLVNFTMIQVSSGLSCHPLIWLSA